MADFTLTDETKDALATSLDAYLRILDDMTQGLQGNLLEDVRLFKKTLIGTVQEVIEGRLSVEGGKKNLWRVWSGVRSDLLAVQQESVARRGEIILSGVGSLLGVVASIGTPVLKPIFGPILAAALS